MADQPLHLRSDAELEAVLRDLADDIAWPAGGPGALGGPDLAAVVRSRIEAGDVPASRRAPRLSRPARWAVVLAVVVALGVVALAGAAVLGLPGLRLNLGPVPVSPPPTNPPPTVGPSPSRAVIPGSTMRLGALVDLAGIEASAGFPVRTPGEPGVGPPDAAYLDRALGGQVTLVWASRPDLPATLQPGVGLVLTQFRGAVENGFYTKAIGSGTVVEPVMVDARRGYWLHGDPHFFWYVGPTGQVSDPRRWVGDALLWADDGITYRLETALGRDRTIAIAESMR